MVETAHEFFKGYPPVLEVKAGNPEALKYGKMWNLPAYRVTSPGEDLSNLFLEVARPRPGSEVIDFGCGTGRGGAALIERGKLRVTLVDFVNNCLDESVRELLAARPDEAKFIKADLEQPLAVVAEYGFCCDVMEHIPEERVEQVLRHILLAAQHVFFSISTCEDSCGALIGEKLHLTVQKYGWWLDQLAKLGCVVHWSQNIPLGLPMRPMAAAETREEASAAVSNGRVMVSGGTALFYVSAWPDGQAVVDIGVVNVSPEKIKENIRVNCARGLTQVSPHEENDLEAMIVGGGPSLAEFEDEIKQKRAEGVKLITLNGAYNWALEHGLTPSAQVIVDARAFNARFVKPVVDGCKYLISSQCDPSVFEGLPPDRTLIWHTGGEEIHDILIEHYPIYWCIPGGSTVLLRAILMFRMLGYKRFHLYGCDSCVRVSDEHRIAGDAASATGVTGGQHHAYAQPENAGLVYPVTCGGRMFWCQAWMASQAQEFINLIKMVGDEIELAVYGDGLLAHILTTGATLYDEATEKTGG